jgi:hypothetical protein
VEVSREELERRLKAAAEFTAKTLAEMDSEDEQVEKVAELWEASFPPTDSEYLTVSDDQSIRAFIRRGLNALDLAQAISITMKRFSGGRDQGHYHRFRYFCGVCWRLIKEPETRKELKIC